MNEQNNKHGYQSSKKHTPTQVNNIVIENEDGFELDWDSIEENVKTSQRHKHRHHSQRHSSKGHRSSRHRSGSNGSRSGTGTDGTRLKHTVQVNEKFEKKRKPLALKIFIVLLIIILCIAIGLLISFAILRYRGEKALFTTENINIETIEGAETQNKGQTVTYNGKTYTFNPYVTSILFMGIDKEEFSLEDNIRGTGGQADPFIYWFTIHPQERLKLFPSPVILW